MEKSLIAYYRATDPAYGYNISSGGDGLDPELMQDMWKDEAFRGYMSRRMREAWTDPEKRTRRSNTTRVRWANPEFREYATQKVIEACHKSVLCVETGEIFFSIRDAAMKLGVSSGNIVRSIKTGYRCGGYHWMYANCVS